MPHSIFIPAPRRVRRKRTQATALPTTLTLLSATLLDHSNPNATVRLMFDAIASDPIVNLAAADWRNWTATIDGLAFEGSALEQSGPNIVLLSLTSFASATGPNTLNYGSNPSDIGTESGRMLMVFEGRAIEA